MIKMIASLGIILMLGISPISVASANTNIDFRGRDFTGGISFENKLNRLQQFVVKKDATYDESKDPALRKGTENWEEPQGSFFVIPAVVVGIIALILFFNREK
jgi:hypothetical protein